eukprot:4243068-Karenia_brevis.AAC.1
MPSEEAVDEEAVPAPATPLGVPEWDAEPEMPVGQFPAALPGESIVDPATDAGDERAAVPIAKATAAKSKPKAKPK